MFLEVIKRFLADTLMTADHVDQQDVEYNDFKGEVQPRHVDNHRDEACDNSGIKGENIGIFHQWQAKLAEVVAEVL